MKPDLRIFKTETTKYWKPEIVERAGRLYDVYVFDANRHVNACELTPSYEMNYVGPTWTNSIDDDEEQQRLYEDVRVGVMDNDQVSYFHAKGVNVETCEKFHLGLQEWKQFLDDADGDEEEALRALIEKACEGLSCNGYIY